MKGKETERLRRLTLAKSQCVPTTITIRECIRNRSGLINFVALKPKVLKIGIPSRIILGAHDWIVGW